MKNNYNPFETLTYGPVKMNLNEKTLDLCWHSFAVFQFVKFSNLINSNICKTNIYWNKSNFPSKSNFKSDEDKIKHSLSSCEGIVNCQGIVASTRIEQL